jgi:NAD(P)-dependent dehydrogenase (short-subunit alcohol dehydrogenase family)
MGGHIAFPAFSLYHATKWGIEGFYEAFAQEVEPFGIHTTLVEPGMIRTSFYEAATRVPVSEPYQGGPADRRPIPLDQMPGGQTKVVAAIIEVRLEVHDSLLSNADITVRELLCQLVYRRDSLRRDVLEAE